MIKHHPSKEILHAHAEGNLPISVSVAVAIHIEMCSECQHAVDQYTASLAMQNLGMQNPTTQSLTTDKSTIATTPEDDFGLEFDVDSAIAAITDDTSLATVKPKPVQNITFSDKSIPMPRALSQLNSGDWLKLGKLSRSRIELEDENLRSSMLFIDAGGEVPHHTHHGYEITLLLDGSFTDEMGEYNKGDFMWLDGQHKHQPETINGCLCYTVVSDALHFSHGLSRLLNPIGKLIY